MRIVIQRVTEGSVSIVEEKKPHEEDCDRVAANRIRKIGKGFVILLGVCEEDTEEDVEWLVKKVVNLRVFDDENGVMNRSIMDTGGECLVVSQFTLFASYKKGNRPSWLRAARHEISVPLYERFCQRLQEEMGREVKTGEFGANMSVSIVNDGPVTICMDTKNKE
jgi:D-tyrosyl-tRNA(Tyr) deacylase